MTKSESPGSQVQHILESTQRSPQKKGNVRFMSMKGSMAL